MSLLFKTGAEARFAYINKLTDVRGSSTNGAPTTRITIGAPNLKCLLF